MEYGCHGFDPGLDGQYLLNGIKYDKSSTAVAPVRAHPDKYEKNFDAVVVFLTLCIDKRSPTLSVKVAFVTQSRSLKQQKTSASCGTFKGKIKLKKWSREEYIMPVAQHQKLYELQKKVRLIKKKKTK